MSEGSPLFDRRRLLVAAAAMPLAWLLRPLAAAAALSAPPKSYRITTNIALPDMANSATLSVPLASGATDRLQLADIAWQGRGSRAEVAADPNSGAMVLRLTWSGGRRPRSAMLAQTVMLSEPAPDGPRTLQQFVDRIAAAAILVPAQPHAIRFQTAITPPAGQHPPAKPAATGKVRHHPKASGKATAKAAHKPSQPQAHGAHGTVVQARLPTLAKPSGVR